MYATTYKNGNALIHPEGHYYGLWREFVADLAYIDDLNVIDVLDPCVYGNDYATIPLLVSGPSGVYVYEVSPSDYEAAKRGACFRLYANDEYEAFDVPEYYDFYSATIDGTRGTIYKLCAKKWEDVTTDIDRAEACGCIRLGTQAEYAPEMRGIALFVPNGISHGFE